MATFDLPYAKEHLGELFEETRQGAEVLIVRSDGRMCQSLPMAMVPAEARELGKLNLRTLRLAR
jgi:hypothetical protein